MCLTHPTTEKDPKQGNPLSAWMGRAMDKYWPKRPSDRQLQEAKKACDRVITPVAKAVCVSAHLAPPGFLQAKQLCHLHTQLSLGQSSHRQKKKKRACSYACRVTSFMSNSLWPCRLLPARLLYQRRGSPGKNTGTYCPVLVAIPF